MRGGARNNKPAALRQAHGSRVRPHHRPSDVPPGPTEPLDAPVGLSPDALAFWAYYSPLLAAVGVLTPRDRDALVDYCEALAELQDIRRQRQDAEYRRVYVSMVQDMDGGVKVKAETNPLDAQYRQWMQVARLLRQSLGLDPVSRERAGRVGDDGGDTESRLAQIQQQAQIRRVK